MSETKQDDGGPAFPKPASPPDGVNYDWEGMTLRDYFSAAAMQGWLASFGEGDGHPAACGAASGVAKWSYVIADAMLAARKGGAK